MNLYDLRYEPISCNGLSLSDIGISVRFSEVRMCFVVELYGESDLADTLIEETQLDLTIEDMVACLPLAYQYLDAYMDDLDPSEIYSGLVRIFMIIQETYYD